MSRGFKIFLGVFFLIAVLILLPVIGPIGAMIVRLLLGWITFASGVLPKIRVNPAGLAMFAACLALATVVGHRFCRWLRQGEPWHWRWTLAGLAGLVVLFASGMAFTGVAHQTGWLLRSPEPLFRTQGSERNASASLKTIATAQADFRGNDRDGNRINDFWRADIAGLYVLKFAGSDEMMKLIELSVAGADARPSTAIENVAVRSPKAGYWYRALRFKDETTPDPDRFAAIAYPDSPSAGRWIFVISEQNTIYRKPVTEGPIPEFYPEDPLKEGWTKLD